MVTPQLNGKTATSVGQLQGMQTSRAIQHPVASAMQEGVLGRLLEKGE